MKRLALMAIFMTFVCGLAIGCAGGGPWSLRFSYSLSVQNPSVQQLAQLKSGIVALADKYGMLPIPQGSDSNLFAFAMNDDDGVQLSVSIRTTTGEIGIVRFKADSESAKMRSLRDEVETLLRGVVGVHGYTAERWRVGTSMFH
jgi:hypothetical protein